jgi:hypothetical protein
VEVRVFSTAPFQTQSNKRIERGSVVRVLVWAAVFVAGFAAVASAQSVGSKYDIQGTNFDGGHYGGTAVITRSSNSTCRIHWDTGSVSDGICMLANKSLAAAYKMQDGQIGLVLYDLQPDGTLTGIWTIADKSGAGTETLTPAK